LVQIKPPILAVSPLENILWIFAFT